MDAYQWNAEFATIFNDNFGDSISFFPIDSNLFGKFTRQKPDDQPVSGEYNLTRRSGEWYLEWAGAKFRISFKDNGFDLFTGETVAYSLTRTIK